MIVGNGGSAAIASHVAVDLNKNCAVRAMAFNDAAALTCYANDYGYDEVFAQQVERHGLPQDILIAISSSGSSRNILNAVHAAKEIDRCQVVTFSGFAGDNPLRRLGHVNFYIPSREYGFVEIAHQILLHAVTDALGEQRKVQKEAAE
jgi:D-sedoheptulose 7-phosphate isomerase